MTDKLPPNLLQLFAPRPPLPYAPPIDILKHEKKPNNIQGVSGYVHLLKEHDPDYKPTETRNEKQTQNQEKIKQQMQNCTSLINEFNNYVGNPKEDPNIKSDPYKTIIVARLSYEITEPDLKRQFEYYGPVENIRIIKASDGKPRGYAFIEFENERDMKDAYYEADGIKIKGRRIVVDVEFGRTSQNWYPRRLGGGLGGTRRGAEHENQRHSGREITNKNDLNLRSQYRSDRKSSRSNRRESDIYKKEEGEITKTSDLTNGTKKEPEEKHSSSRHKRSRSRTRSPKIKHESSKSGRSSRHRDEKRESSKRKIRNY